MSQKLLEKILAWCEHMAPLLLEAAVIMIIGQIISKAVLKIMSKGLKSKHIDNTAHTFMMSIVRTLIFILSFIMALSALNVPMSSIVATVGAAGLTLGLALQNSLSNVAGGFLILFSKPFQCGDYIKINEHEGTVKAISILYTNINTLDNKSIFIPNGTVANNTVINYTREKLRHLELTFLISYESDYDKARKAIRDVIERSEYYIDRPTKPLIVMCDHADSGIHILTRVWVKTENYWPFRYYMFENVKKEFDKVGIEIPYNHVDVTLLNSSTGTQDE
ncbi:MAG: mechanosensitive ion channel [Ruminococcus sp.]|nr:mechanosensitive ion channel [Ruminococcus sp.]